MQRPRNPSEFPGRFQKSENGFSTLQFEQILLPAAALDWINRRARRGELNFPAQLKEQNLVISFRYGAT
jgi:hypothetical protein